MLHETDDQRAARERSERSRDSAHKRDPDAILERRKSYNQRLRDGFAILQGDANGYPDE